MWIFDFKKSTTLKHGEFSDKFKYKREKNKVLNALDINRFNLLTIFLKTRIPYLLFKTKIDKCI